MSEFWNALFGSTIGTLVVVGYFLTWLLIPWVLLKRKVHETAAIAWLIGILFVPFVGAILCVLIGNTRWEKQSRKKRRASDEIRQAVAEHHEESRVEETSLGSW